MTLPLIAFEVNLVIYKEDALFRQPLPLALGAGAVADFALGIDHPLPGYIIRTGGQGIADPAWAKGFIIQQGNAVWRRDHLGDLPVGGNLPMWDLTDKRPYLFLVALWVWW